MGQEQLNNLTLEQALEQLERMTEEMDEKELSLEQSFAMYQKGVELIRLCHEKIDKVEKELVVMQEA